MKAFTREEQRRKQKQAAERFNQKKKFIQTPEMIANNLTVNTMTKRIINNEIPNLHKRIQSEINKIKMDFPLVRQSTLKNIKNHIIDLNDKIYLYTFFQLDYEEINIGRKNKIQLINEIRDKEALIMRTVSGTYNFLIENIDGSETPDFINAIKNALRETPSDKILLATYPLKDKGGNDTGEFKVMTVNEKFLEHAYKYLVKFIDMGGDDGGGGGDGFSGGDGGTGGGGGFDQAYKPEDFQFTHKNKSRLQKGGGYFSYINNSKLDLSPLQIFNVEQYTEKLKKGIENCVIHSLRSFKIPEPIIESLKNIVQKYDSNNQEKAILNDDFIARNFKTIAEKIDKRIQLTKFYYDKNDKFISKNMKIYGESKKELIKICLYENHFMPNVELEINKFVVKNYDEVKDINNFMNITRKEKGKFLTSKSSKSKANTPDIIKMLEKHKLYGKHEILTKHIKYKESDYSYLDGEGEQHLIRSPIINLPDNDDYLIERKQTVYFADCETYKHMNVLKPFLVGVVAETNDSVLIYRNVFKFMTYITNNTDNDSDIIVYFHNAKFDYSVMFADFIKDPPTVKDGIFYQGMIRFNKRQVIIRDSLKHIALPLSKFKSTYMLEVGKKDIYMPYSLYMGCTIWQKSIKYEDLIHHTNDCIENDGSAIEKLDTEEKKQLIEPYCYMTKSGNKRFKHMDFMREYLESDCLTLKYGFLKHRDNIFQLCDRLKTERLDIFNILTTSSLSYKLYQAIGTYDDVYELSGNKRRFVQKSIMGGRVGTKRNEKHMKKEVQDFDGVSLYPSAIYRLKADYGGIPTGEATVITDFELELSKGNKTYFVVEIEVLDIKDNQQISFFNYKNKDGIRTYSGDYKEFRKHNKDGKIIIDKITLEDYIEFQGLKYKFVQGLRWDSFDPIMSNMTYDLFEIRKEYKAMLKPNGDITEEGELMQSTTKLILNSIYGKTLLKPSTEKITTKLNKCFDPVMVKVKITNEKTGKTSNKWVNKKDKEGNKIYKQDEEGNNIVIFPADKYLSEHFNSINYMIKEKMITNFHMNHNDFKDKNCCHVGGMILSMSKRIMNEVMNTANENNIEIYYQDTDSMHMPKENVELLATKFTEKYKRCLIGKELGQFHNDLEAWFNGLKLNCISETCVILGKKAYLDILRVDMDCPSNVSKIIKAGIPFREIAKQRAKHIRLKGIGSKVFLENYKDVLGVYTKMYEGIPFDFDLTKGTVKFDIQNMNSIKQKTKFIRTVIFGTEEQKKKLCELKKIINFISI